MFKKLFISLFIITLGQTSYASSIHNYIHESPKQINDIQFIDENNNINSLNDFAGKVVLINFWATWCKPCVEEMPSISRLQNKLSGMNVEIIPISVDFKGLEAVDKFFKENKLDNLSKYLDKNGYSFKTLELRALPTTIILNTEGQEVARVLGEIEWDTKEIKNYLIELSSQ